jgi:tetratricopeptide (TPR) repeat protein
MRSNQRLLAVVFLVCGVTSSLRGQAQVWQGTLTLPAYDEGQPDPNPPFDQFSTSRFSYPYTLRNNLTDHRVDHAWRAIFLENEYLKCSVLPDIGGHVYTCIDKITGKSMFYANPSIKKANIGYRGAWAAFGIEFNFPVSHNWVSMSPVDFAFGKNPDGSASVTVGNVDRVYGMEWSVELVLRPHSTVLEEKVTLNNRSDARHRFYWWNNAAVEVWDDSRIEYPMRFAASHGFTEVQPWPVDADGTDLSIVRNQTKGPVSLFVHGSREQFMGIWNPHTNTGTVHFADYAQLPGKKIWSWGVDADGLDWRHQLSDNESAYAEVQAGPFRNQETYAFLEPRQTIRFSEFWMPVRDIGGISRANLAGVVKLGRRGNTLVVGFNANQPIPRGSVHILDGNRSVFDEKVDLAPERSWEHELPLPDPQRKYTFEARDRNGTILLRQTEDSYDWTPANEIRVGPQQDDRTPVPEKRTEDDWVQLGKEQESNGQILPALRTYKDALARFPQSFAAQKAAGRLAAGMLRFPEAVTYLEAVRRRDTTDGEVAYYLGLAYDGLGDAAHARTAYEAAYRLPPFRAASALRLGEMTAREGDMRGAERYLTESFEDAPGDLRAVEELVAVRSALGANTEAHQLGHDWLARFPLSYFLREELGSADVAHLADDSDRILNIASEYMRLGLYQRALEVLSRQYPTPVPDQTEPGALPPGKNPLLGYFRGFCKEKLGQPALAEYAAASKLSIEYVFPSGETELQVLQAALQANPGDATAHYLLGTSYFSRDLTDMALAEWTESRKVNSALPVLDASTGLAMLHEKHDPALALESFRRGLQSDPSNVAIYLGVDQALSLMGRPSQERVEALEKYPDQASMPTDVIYELILNLAEAGDYGRATGLFHNRFFARQEGGTNVRQVWIELQLQRTIALAKAGKCADAISAAEDLGSTVSGLSFTQDGMKPVLDSARTNYLVGGVYATCGKVKEAETRFQAASSASAAGQIEWAWMAAQKLPGFDQHQWNRRLESALAEAENLTETSGSTGYWFYTAGSLQAALGRRLEGEATLRKVFLQPDRMLAYHLARLALMSTPQ